MDLGEHKIVDQRSLPLTGQAVVQAHHHRPRRHHGRAGPAQARPGDTEDEARGKIGPKLTLAEGLVEMPSHVKVSDTGCVVCSRIAYPIDRPARTGP